MRTYYFTEEEIALIEESVLARIMQFKQIGCGNSAISEAIAKEQDKLNDLLNSLRLCC